jgi:hypothetical protein
MKYDVRRMSSNGLRDLAHDLYTAGAIGLSDSRFLALEPVTYPSDWPGWSVFETPREGDGRRDWIREIEVRILRGSADCRYLAYQQSLLSFLKRVEAARPPSPEPAVTTPMPPGNSPLHGASGMRYPAASWPTASR